MARNTELTGLDVFAAAAESGASARQLYYWATAGILVPSFHAPLGMSRTAWRWSRADVAKARALAAMSRIMEATGRIEWLGQMLADGPRSLDLGTYELWVGPVVDADDDEEPAA